MSDISRVGIVGCGLMGSGLAEVCARPGIDVLVAVSSDDSARRGRDRLTGSLDRAVRKGRTSEKDKDGVLGRITFTTELADLADRELVIEAVTEDEPLKLGLFARLDRIVEDPEAILATNTSSLPVMKLARATARPEQVLGTHFFSPVPAMPLVELTGSLLTSESTVDRVEAFAVKVLDKEVIRSPDRAGFVVNALLVPYLLAAMRMVESGFALVEDVDKGMMLGCAHPMGPLRLADLIGLDTLAAVAAGLYDEFREPHYAAPPLLARMVDGGLLGKKSGRGFYSYEG
ncbi:3-hydroxybutyryl-CoA dehydrogenase [Saccharomonospora xinjiangensis]|uniref:3-hydroxyacyl-CoA dehydrogenase n=1 Tax=Saccharomonospora xinjiangensis XJ-54 TaxID=882086 RepID=I0UY26_9PSEU|nr:3-hydroxybutyryl-CoA dehydrogenase [Saccharomonospora xinjiangensis]EID52779.1 3-hydroxyacyl-CoA dehydrogenase [Saccharomonospora xinjiangensis XJ-54]